MTGHVKLGRGRWALCLAALAALHVSGCQVMDFLPKWDHDEKLFDHKHHRRSQAASTPAVEVGGLVAAPGSLEIGSGLTLAEALRQAGGYAPPASAGLPNADVLVLLMRDGSRYHFSLALVEQSPAVGAIVLRPRDRIAVLGWSSTDLTRGLALLAPGAATPTRPALAVPPLTNKTIEGLFDWVVVVRKLANKAAIEKGNEDMIRDKTRDFKDRVDDLRDTLPGSDRPELPANLGEKNFPDWADLAVAAVTKSLAGPALTETKGLAEAGWHKNWAYLRQLYAKDPQLKAGKLTLDIPFASEDRGILSAAQRTVVLRQPDANSGGYHPNLRDLENEKLGDVVMLRRRVNGQALEFMLARESADQELLSRVLVFSGDEVQVSSPVRHPMVLSSLVAPALMQQMRGQDGPRLGKRLHDDGACRLPSLAGVPVVGGVLESSRRQLQGVAGTLKSGVNTTLQNTVGP